MNATLASALPQSAVCAPAEGSKWRYDPWLERPRVAVLAALCTLGLCALVAAAHEPFLVALGLCLFCAAAFSPALTPVECRIDAQGVAKRGLLGWERREWSAIRRIEALPAGVFVSPFAKRHLLDSTRGLTLPMPRAQRDVLLAEIRARAEAARG